MFAATSAKSLNTKENIPIKESNKSTFLRSYSIEIAPPETESLVPLKTTIKSEPTFEERFDINIDRLFAIVRELSDNQKLILYNQSKLLRPKESSPVQYFLAKKLDKLSCKICCSTVISIFTLLGIIAVVVLSVITIYEYMT